jgi:hypothetical protein
MRPLLPISRSSPNSPTKSWRELYRDALLESDKTQILARITKAEKVMLQRARELFGGDALNIDERKALDNAMYFLQALRNILTFEKFATGDCRDADEFKAA